MAIEPKTNDPGILTGKTMIPTSPPLAYVPCKYETGITDGKIFLPTEPDCNVIKNQNFPLIEVPQSVSRESPYIDQVDCRVATPCVSPYNWTVAAANRTLILDTTPGLMLSSITAEEYKTVTTAGSFTVTNKYKILTVGTTDYTLIGAANNNPGTIFTATGVGAGDGTALNLTKTYNSTDGVGFSWTFGPVGNIAANAVVVGQQYQIITVGSTNWVAMGASSNSTYLLFTATATGSGTGKCAVPDPRPALRAGSTRYNFTGNYIKSSDLPIAVGTIFDGTPFLPATGELLKNGTLKIRAYRYGLLLSEIASYAVTVKIGGGTAIWNKIAGTLALSTTTPTATIKYSTDGSAPTLIYAGPIAIAATTLVRWYITKTDMVDSDEWQTTVTFGAEGPDDFTTNYVSTLPAFSNSPVNVTVKFQQKPNWYISPSGVGTGLTPDSPSNATAVIGLNTAAGSATANQIIWCSEGTYTANSATSYFLNSSAGLIVRGGFNADFTERDVMNRKTIFTSTAFDSPGATAAINNQVLAMNTFSGVLDGLWGESEFADNTSTGAYTSASIFSAGKIVNCHFDISVTVPSIAAGLSRGTGLTIGGSAGSNYPKFYGCTANVDFIIPSCPAGGSGQNGGGIGCPILIFYGPMEFCDVDATLTVGNAGNGGDNGNGGSINAGVTVGGIPGGVGLMSTCNVTATTIVGNGGDAGAETPTATTGGNTSAYTAISRGDDGQHTTSVVSATAGNGGNAITTGGSTQVAVNVTGDNRYGTSNATSICGDSGPGSFCKSQLAHWLGFNEIISVNSQTGDAPLAGSFNNVATMTFQPPVGAEINAPRIQSYGSYRTKVSGGVSCGAGVTPVAYIIWRAKDNPGDDIAIYFEPGDISLTEGAPYGNGNPVRVDHAADSTTGWFSGLDAGEGAPLLGYETPADSAIKRGDYWE
jgi:hypothetical protein